ncbi:MAG: hypothetical protein PHE02_03260 [Lachnospiraceae bacterium]|nr:hypothetical protein [Lachnospiraceae bacterium]
MENQEKKTTFKLELMLSEQELQEMLKWYHYEVEDLAMLTHLYYAIEPVIDAQYVIQHNPGYIFVEENNYVVIAVTLGGGIDGVIDAYEDAGCIAEAYMLDCIGLQLLRKAYSQVENELNHRFRLWQTSLEFMGDNYPIECMKEILENVNLISCNKACMLSPGKSSVYIARVQSEKPENDMSVCGDICAKCPNVNCENRNIQNYSIENRSIANHSTENQGIDHHSIMNHSTQNHSIENHSIENHKGKSNRSANGSIDQHCMAHPMTYGYQRIFGEKDHRKGESCK